MKSLGVIETRGLVAAVQAVDAACKSAGVSCIG
ncbi:MAG: BMC domain-containing protein, partial [Raoultella planticola]